MTTHIKQRGSDLSFRLADAARRILYCPEVAAEGDASPSLSITRRSSPEASAFSVISGLVHAQFCVRDSRLRRTARRLRPSWMVKLSVLLLADGKRRSALEFVIESLMISALPAGLRQLAKCLFRLPSRRLSRLRAVGQRNPNRRGSTTSRPHRLTGQVCINFRIIIAIKNGVC